MNNHAVAKIQMINASIRCFVFGLLALLPFIGIAFGISALVVSAKVRERQRQFWNPARASWICGVVCATIGIIFWSLIFILIIWRALNPNP